MAEPRRPCEQGKKFCWSKDWICPHLLVVDPHSCTMKCVYPEYGTYHEG